MRRFSFRLALALGMTVRELEGRMTAAEFAEWVAYSEIEPFGPQAEDVRWARLTAHQQRAKGTVRDYMLGQGRRRAQTPGQVDDLLMHWASMMGGRVQVREGRL